MNNDMTMDVFLWVIWIANLIWTIVNIATWRKLRKIPRFELMFRDDLTPLKDLNIKVAGKPLPPFEMSGNLKGEGYYVPEFRTINPILIVDRDPIFTEKIEFEKSCISFDNDQVGSAKKPDYRLADIWACDECGQHNRTTLIKCSKCGSLSENQ